MAIGSAIYSILSGDSTVTGLVADRIDPNFVPQGKSMPAITYTQITGQRDTTMDGVSGLVDSRYQINAWGSTYASVEAVAEAIRGAMVDYSGTAGGKTISWIKLDNEGDIPVYENGVDQLIRYGRRHDYIIWFME
jgi:hypothetical protein